MGELEDKLNAVLNNPKEMEKIMALARSFMGSGTSNRTPSSPEPIPPPGLTSVPVPDGLNLDEALGGLDPSLMKKLVQGFTTGGNGSSVLLKSIAPHLKSERQGQLKRAITIAQMVRAARAIF